MVNPQLSFFLLFFASNGARSGTQALVRAGKCFPQRALLQPYPRRFQRQLCSSPLYLLPRLEPVPASGSLSVSVNRHITGPQTGWLETAELRSQVGLNVQKLGSRQDHASCKPREEFYLTSSCFWWLLTMCGFPHSFGLPSPSGDIPPGCLSSHVYLLMRTPVIGLRDHLTPA